DRCEVLARVSHELRTPLHAVLGFARLIAADQPERLPATQAHRLDQVLRSGARLLRLVDDVLGIPPSDGPVAGVDDLPPPRGRVLYIEDNPVNVLLVRELLARWPEVQLLTADDGETGLMMARTDAPDLVLLDMQLPGMAGLDVLRALRSAPDAGTPVVVLSANALTDQRDEAVSAGANGYLTKPFAFDQFLEQVRRHLH
ncbi:MAG: response regulator, partial [Rhizobacter sp.]